MFALFVVVGSALCFAGRLLLKPTLFVTGVLTAAFVVIFIFYTEFLSNDTEKWVFYAVFGGAVLAGLVLGYFLAKFDKVGAFALAAWGGFAVGLLLYNAFGYKLNVQWTLWLFTIGMAAVFGVLTIYFFDHILIHSTAVLGSFLVVYGFGLVEGHYPNPFNIVIMI